MKLMVIFGSQSDANIFEPLKARLMADGHDLDFRMISVHRSPDLLDRALVDLHVDAVVAGAGLAAHLPGMLAAKLMVPILGIPCAAALGGMDSTCAILQMPFGIPVLTTAPDQFGEAVQFVKRWGALERAAETDGIHIVLDRTKRSLGYMPELLERANKITEKTGLHLQIVERPNEHAINICLVDIDANDPEAPLPYPLPGRGSHELRIYVPVFNPAAYRDAASALLLVRRMASLTDGLWVGANNVGNGVLSALELYNQNGQFNAFLTNAKKGYIHR